MWQQPKPSRNLRRKHDKGRRGKSQRALHRWPVGMDEAHVFDDDEEFTTRDVNPLHHLLQNGVRFNTQTVPSLGRPLKRLTATQTAQWVAKWAKNRITIDEEDINAIPSAFGESRFARKIRIPPSVEQYSLPANTLVDHHAQSLMQICLLAFAEHYPLTLSPDHVWLAIAYGAAKHIDSNAEALRTRFVSFEGKKKLTVRKDDTVVGDIPVHEWESDVFRGFSEQIRSHIGNDIHELLTTPFSTTSRAEMAAAEITLMAATAQYFEYEMFTACGIPSLQLEGTVEDWMAVRTRAERLQEVLLPDFAENWLPNLLPVLDEFVSAYKGNVNHSFWQRMVKIYHGSSSGATPVVSGWINNLYPYLIDGKENKFMKAWTRSSQYHGPDPKKFPNIVSSVPVNWSYHGADIALHFHAGYLGMTQDADTLALRPYVGWIVTRDAPNGQKQ